MYYLLYKNVVVNCFFFLKQKTAYEMHISDWSSDVCSSDLMGSATILQSMHSPKGMRVKRKRNGRIEASPRSAIGRATIMRDCGTRCLHGQMRCEIPKNGPAR